MFLPARQDYFLRNEARIRRTTAMAANAASTMNSVLSKCDALLFVFGAIVR